MDWHEMNWFGKALAVLCVIGVIATIVTNGGVLIAILVFDAGR
jgi:hypothetical protein